MRLFDTNILLSNLDRISENDKFLISSVTIQELEDIKTNKNKSDELRFSARNAVRFLDSNQDKYDVVIYDNTISRFLPGCLEDTPDNRIICCAKSVGAEFVSNDILCRLIAKNYFGLQVNSMDSIDEIYKGYQMYSGNTEKINELLSFSSDWTTNEYIIIENTDDGSIKEMRYDGSKFVSLKLPPSKFIKAKNSLQRCALDALLNPDISIVAVLGGYGSGKTHLAMQMALYAVKEKGVQSKILGIREPWGEGREIGFLPGTMEEKTDLYFQPLAQQLRGGEFELESLKQQGIIESIVPYFMKGTTYNETVMVCDEAEDLTEKQIRLVGTRIGQNSRIFFSGDYKQSLLNQTVNNALIKMCNEFKGSSKFACIYLGEDVRSETSKMFADLFER